MPEWQKIGHRGPVGSGRLSTFVFYLFKGKRLIRCYPDDLHTLGIRDRGKGGG